MHRFRAFALAAVLISSSGLALDVGDPAPTFVLPSLGGDDIFLRDFCGERLRDPSATPRVVILDFWATWCAPCRRSLPAIRETVARFDSTKVVLIIVSEDDAKTRSRVAGALLPLAGNEYCALDTYRWVMQKTYGLSAIPRTFVISPRGKIEAILASHEDPAVLSNELSKALARVRAE
ncbi:TlpA family protein disulfide reductase [Candidatus Fermentibacteria bacterium]|nr:TlpA family protein disulfide reductase [Candidatus Fermentibacteria bacterium]